MAQNPEPQQGAQSTNALLASILQVSQDSNLVLKGLLVSSRNLEDSNTKILASNVALLNTMQKLVDAIIGGETHVFTVKVTQLAKELAGQLKKLGG